MVIGFNCCVFYWNCIERSLKINFMICLKVVYNLNVYWNINDREIYRI